MIFAVNIFAIMCMAEKYESSRHMYSVTLCVTSTAVGLFLRGNHLAYRPDLIDRNNAQCRDALGNTL